MRLFVVVTIQIWCEVFSRGIYGLIWNYIILQLSKKAYGIVAIWITNLAKVLISMFNNWREKHFRADSGSREARINVIRKDGNLLKSWRKKSGERSSRISSWDWPDLSSYVLRKDCTAFSTCLLCPCKSDIPVKFSSLCFRGERQEIPPLALCTCCCPRSNVVRIAQQPVAVPMQQRNTESLAAIKKTTGLFLQAQRVSPALRCKGCKVQWQWGSSKCLCVHFPAARASRCPACGMVERNAVGFLQEISWWNSVVVDNLV